MSIGTLLLSFLIFSAEKPDNTKESLKALLTHLKVGQGSTVAEIGSGRGKETWVFAEIVGPEGYVYSEEVDKKKVKQLTEEIKKRKYKHVEAVLGTDESPNIPDKAVDIIFMKRVYHHFSKPREMLRSMWNVLKPGGRLVIVDQHRGTLRDWVPREWRAKKHFFIAETTIVREAREEGFVFVECAEQCWHDKKPFVVVFMRPKGLAKPAGDPDPFMPIDIKAAEKFFTAQKKQFSKSMFSSPVFIALGEGRKLIKPLLKISAGKPCEIILEEWATQKKEKPAFPANLDIPSFLTDSGDPEFKSEAGDAKVEKGDAKVEKGDAKVEKGDAKAEQSDAIFFLDTYHLLFHGKTLLGKIKEKLTPGGRVYILDRKSEKKLNRRMASHRRKIQLNMVKEEMEKAGFKFLSKGPNFAKDRFMLVFGKK